MLRSMCILASKVHYGICENDLFLYYTGGVGFAVTQLWKIGNVASAATTEINKLKGLAMMFPGQEKILIIFRSKERYI